MTSLIFNNCEYLVQFFSPFPFKMICASGEIVAESCHLGTIHPPGYPLITMLYHLAIRYLPWGSPAWRANICSSFFDMMCGVFIMLSAGILGEILSEDQGEKRPFKVSIRKCNTQSSSNND